MITRRRRRCPSISSEHNESLDVGDVEVVENVENILNSLEQSPDDSVGASGLDELNDLFGIEDLKWSLERDLSSPLFDIDPTTLDGYGAEGNSFGPEDYTASSPERTSSDERQKSKRSHSKPVTNKNAIAARLNRLKKKEYVSSLERKVGCLVSENGLLKQENSQLTKRVEELEDETRYLRAVLANESTLAQLLSRLSGLNGMKLSSSLFQGASSNDHDYALPRKRVKVEDKETSGGVCLHVDKDHVSVEFCTKCAESASTSFKM
ncbi:CREB/ATF bZIP transcription factor isoform X2 [Gouania willdenowi]|uniref:CREB/ATF bZIP transcription factor isoform X2 n=1 Tax=Gouania willdenowi TaxID=441366 RepID=UPI001054325B|nr:CREB/ATF bZIP transcription factor isoform X2 [Gouania willdenowi]